MQRVTFFDFDGVIADTETIHFDGFKVVIDQEWGMSISRSEYDKKWIGFDDEEGFWNIAKDIGFDLGTVQHSKAMALKEEWVASQLGAVLLIENAIESITGQFELSIFDGGYE